MSLAGNLRTMDLPEVLQWIASARKTGTLHLERRSVTKKIYFQQGGIYTSWSNDPRETLGQILVRERLISEEQLFKALLSVEQKGGMLGVLLIADGTVGEEDLRRVLKIKAEESIYDLFLWPEGKFEFKDGETAGDDLIPIELDVTSAIMEGVRRVDEWGRIRTVFPSLDVSFTLPARRARRGDRSHRATAPGAGRLRAHPGRPEPGAAAQRVRDGGARLHPARPRPARRSWRPGRPAAKPDHDTVGTINGLLAEGAQRLGERRYELGPAGLRAGADARPPEPERQEGAGGRRSRRATASAR